MFSRSRAIVAAAVAGLIMAAAPAFAATTLQYLGSAAGGYSNAQTTVEGPPDLSRNGAAGAFNMRILDGPDAGASFIAWCVDLFTTLKSGSVAYDAGPIGQLYDATNGPLGGGDPIDRVQALFDAAYAPSIPTAKDTSAAFQLALWETVYDRDFDLETFGQPGTPDVGMTSSTTGAVRTTAQGYLDLAKALFESPTPASKMWKITQWRDTDAHPSSQDLVSVTMMPVPAGVLLIGSALALAGAVRARARRRAV